MNPQRPLTDDDIAAVFRRRAARAAAGDLVEEVLVRTITMPQRRGWGDRLRDLRNTRGPARLVAIALLALSASGLALAVASDRDRGITPPPSIPLPTVAPSIRPASADELVAERFRLPFAYRPDPDVHLQLATETRYRWGSEATEEDIPPDYRSIEVVRVGYAAVHGCASGAREAIRTDATGFVEDLEAVGRTRLDDRRMVTLDVRSALSADVGFSCTGDFHLDALPLGSNFVSLRVGSRLYVVDVNGQTVAIVAWAGSADEQREWLPIATRFVESFRFLDEVEQGGQ